MPDTFLVVGLGNPGREYKNNRHNVGFMLLDHLSDILEMKFSRVQANAIIAQALYKDNKIILAKPQTFMNLSGKAVRGLTRFYKVPLENVIVVHDDIDLPLGSIRLRHDGGSGGQKGMESILEYIGTEEFTRVRIGIGRPPGTEAAADYVLKDFSRAELDSLSDVISRSAEAVLDWIDHGLSSAMNKFNRKKSTS